MSAKYFEDALDEQLAIIRETLLRKRAAYGSSNLVSFGELGILVRSFDKMHRLKNLHTQGTNPADEPIDESWLDMIGYSILARIFRNGELELPDRGDSPEKKCLDPYDTSALHKALVSAGLEHPFTIESQKHTVDGLVEYEHKITIRQNMQDKVRKRKVYIVGSKGAYFRDVVREKLEDVDVNIIYNAEPDIIDFHWHDFIALYTPAGVDLSEYAAMLDMANAAGMPVYFSSGFKPFPDHSIWTYDNVTWCDTSAGIAEAIRSSLNGETDAS